jgi:hypothetical protein
MMKIGMPAVARDEENIDSDIEYCTFELTTRTSVDIGATEDKATEIEYTPLMVKNNLKLELSLRSKCCRQLEFEEITTGAFLQP